MNFGVKHDWHAPLRGGKGFGQYGLATRLRRDPRAGHVSSHAPHFTYFFSTLDDCINPNDDACIRVDPVNPARGQNGLSQPNWAGSESGQASLV